MKDMNNLLDNEYLYYNEVDLAEELNFLNKKEANSRISFTAKQQAMDLKSQVYAAMEVYHEMHKLGLDTSGMSVADVIEEVTQIDIADLKGSAGSQMVRGAGEYLDKGMAATKKGLNKFGSWLATKTESR